MKRHKTKRNPYHHVKVRPVRFSNYVKEEITKALMNINNLNGVDHWANHHGFGPSDPGIELLCGVTGRAKDLQEYLQSRFERGELIGLS